MLVTGIVENRGDRNIGMGRADVVEQFTHGSRMNFALGSYLDDFFAMAIQRTQHAIALSSGSHLGKDAREAPDHPENSSQHKVRGIHEEHFARAFRGLAQPWLHLPLKELELKLRIGFATGLAAFAQGHSQLLHGPAELALLKTDARELFDSLCGLFCISHGCRLEGIFQALPKGSQAAGRLIMAIFDNALQAFRMIELNSIGHGICVDL